MHGLTHAIEQAVPLVGGTLAMVAEYTVFGVLALATGAATIAGKLPAQLGRVVEAGPTLTNKLRQRFFPAFVAQALSACRDTRLRAFEPSPLIEHSTGPRHIK